MHDRFRVLAVYDQTQKRAEIEAQRLGCAASGGLRALIEHPDVDVVYILSPQWFGLHALHLACEARKPIYCGLPLSGDRAELTTLARRVKELGIPFMPEFARRCYPATLRLKELLATKLGRPRLILGHSRLFGFDRYAVPGPATQIAPAPLLMDPGSYLLDWCLFLFQSSPRSVGGTQARVVPPGPGEDTGPDFESFVATFPDGATAQIAYGRFDRARWGEATRFLPPPGFQVFAERGAAWLEMPDRIQWWDASGTNEERLPLEPTVGDVLNDQFFRLVHKGQSMAPTIDDALEIARLVEDLDRSHREGIVIHHEHEGT
jgi:predicted dehydrogenase